MSWREERLKFDESASQDDFNPNAFFPLHNEIANKLWMPDLFIYKLNRIVVNRWQDDSVEGMSL